MTEGDRLELAGRLDTALTLLVKACDDALAEQDDAKLDSTLRKFDQEWCSLVHRLDQIQAGGE